MVGKPIKHDWESLKADFLMSKYVSVSEWWRQRLGKELAKDGWMAKATKWWSEDKQRMQAEIRERALEEHKAKLAEMYKPSLKELGDMHRAIIQLAKASINHEINACIDLNTGAVVKPPSLSVLSTNWNIVKTEKGEATSVSEIKPASEAAVSALDEVLSEMDEEE